MNNNRRKSEEGAIFFANIWREICLTNDFFWTLGDQLLRFACRYIVPILTKLDIDISVKRLSENRLSGEITTALLKSDSLKMAKIWVTLLNV